MLLNYWNLPDEGNSELNLSIDGTTVHSTSGPIISGFPNAYRMLSQSSDSIDTIRPSSRISPPPLLRHRPRELPLEFLYDPSSSNLYNEPRVFIPKWSVEDEMIKLSDNIHDGCSDLNTAFDYRYISKQDFTEHLTYQRIKLELLLSASRMAREDIAHPPDAIEVRTPLLIRHVRSLSDLPNFYAYGDRRELCVAFLTMVARTRGIETLSMNQLGPNQTEVYRQIANQLEADMRSEYEEVYVDAKRKVRKRW